jgi:hypothetical protein
MAVPIMFSSKKGVELATSLIVLVVIALIVLVVFFSFLREGIQTIERGTSCESYGHVWAQECDPAVSVQNTLFAKNKQGLVCCMERPGEKNAFEEWKKTILPSPQEDAPSPQDESLTTPPTIDSAPYADNMYALPVAQIPKYNSGPTTGSTKTDAQNDIVPGKSYLKINGHAIGTGYQTPSVYPELISLEAKNNYDDAFECTINIREIAPDGSLLASEQGNKYSQNPCNKHMWIGFTTSLKPNTNYKVNFIIEKPLGTVVYSDYAFVVTNDLTQAQQQTQVSQRSISTRTKTVYRNNENYHFIAPVLIGPSDENTIRMWYSEESAGSSCEGKGTDKRVYQAFNEITIPQGKQLCVTFDILSSQTASQAISQAYTISGFDKAVILDENSYPLYFEQCTTTCAYYTAQNDKLQCKDHSARPTSCQYALDCFWSKTNEDSTGRFCQTCDRITSCEELNTESACEQNQCIATKCEWKTALLGGKCVVVSSN